MFPIIEKLGGIEAALDIIAKRTGKKPSPHAVVWWQRQGFIPGMNAVHLLDAYNEQIGWSGSSYADDCTAKREATSSIEE